MTSDCGTSPHFVDSHLKGDMESRIKDIVIHDPPVTVIVAGHSTLSRVSIGTLTVRITGAQGYIHDMLLPAMNMPGLSRQLFSGGKAALKGVKMIIIK